MTLKYEIYYKNRDLKYSRHGEQHRIDGPARLFYHSSVYWFQYGIPHNFDGPAFKFGRVRRYWIKGVEYSLLRFWLIKLKRRFR